ncbi:phage baseplate assembly protein V [Chryseobacterium luteum]|uniref:phage baseplate assembly protein V n=1 Tax=Chryseobacterium luteum TaxID=421531 RepID=UPI00068B6C1E|nr:phage baseplate assembly protein V [Chryseobacterium luteum]
MKNKEFPSFGTNGRLNHPDDLKKHFSDKTYLDFAKESKSPMVYCFISIDGKDFKGSFAVEIIQNTNHHDTFEITTPDDNFDSFEGYVMENSKNLSGKNITIDFWRYGSSKQSFRGIIGKVTNKKNEGGGYGNLIITGFAPSIFLESGKDCQSFEDKTLAQIISEICSPYPQEAKVKSETLNTKYNIPYTVQYKETDYQFIKRLSVLYGEYFYYNGEDLVFGNKVQPIVKLNEGVDLIDVEFELNIKPQDFGYISYDAVSGEQMTKDSSQSQSQYKENPFQAILINSSKKIFRKKPQMHFNHTGISGRNGSELQEAVRKERENRENLILVKGKSKDPELKIGGRAKISDINSKAMETYRIIEIKHYYNGDTYYNEFIGIPDLFNPPYQDNDAVPFGEIQTGRVIDNNDPLGAGRIRVQFPWQMAKNQKTPWIKTLTDYAGAGRGNYKIPEVGDEVLVGFESNNAEKPFVLGATYNGNEASGYYTAGNDIKAVKTRSGIEQIFNDAEGSWKQSTPDGNFIQQDGKGNTVLNVPKNLTINVGQNFNVQVGQNMTFNVVDIALFNIFKQTIFTTPVLHQISEYYKLLSTSALINSEKDFKVESKDTQLAGFENLLVHSNQSAIINSKGNIEVRGESGTKLSNTASELSMTQVTITSTLFASFRPMNNWNGKNYGFDWYRVADTKKVYGSKWAGDKFYDTLVGQYDKYPSSNPDAKFSMNSTMINSLKNEYGIASLIPWYKVKGKPVEALPSWLLLKKNVDVRVSLDVFIQDKKKLPQNVFVAYEHEYFTIQTSAGAGSANPTAESSPKDNMHYTRLAVRAEKRFSIVDGITIKCIKDIPAGTSKTIRIISDQQEAGFLHVYSNSSKKIDVVLVKVWGDFGNGVKTGSSNGRVELTNALKQANITPNFQEVDLDIRHLRGTSNPNTLIQSNTLMNVNEINVSGNVNGLTLSEYLDDEFRNRPIGKNTDGSFKYENYLRVYFVNEKAFITADRLSVGGIGSPLGGGRCIMYVGGTVRDVAHECCHSLGLGHTFGTASSSSARFLYKFKATENIMDYGHLANITPYSLWKWQWEILRSHSLVQDIVVTPPATPASTPTPSGTPVPTSTPAPATGGS